MRKHNDFFAVGGALRRGCILIRNGDSCSFNLHTRGMGLGLGWGGDVNVQLKSHTYVMLRSTPTLT